MSLRLNEIGAKLRSIQLVKETLELEKQISQRGEKLENVPLSVQEKLLRSASKSANEPKCVYCNSPKHYSFDCDSMLMCVLLAGT